MARKTIIQKGDPVLNKVCHPVTKFDRKLHHLLNDLTDTLAAAGGVGLAAPQIGILRRVVVVINEAGEVIELVNPQIVETSGEQEGFEGCLSLKGLYGLVTRPNHVVVKAQDRDGNEFTVTSDCDLTARCFCHELEHLDGHLFDEHTGELYTEDQLDRMMDEKERQA